MEIRKLNIKSEFIEPFPLNVGLSSTKILFYIFSIRGVDTISEVQEFIFRFDIMGDTVTIPSSLSIMTIITDYNSVMANFPWLFFAEQVLAGKRLIVIGGFSANHHSMNFAHFLFCTLLYGIAFFSTRYLISTLDYSPIPFAFFFDVLCTIHIWIFGTILRNTSLYDPYWSVAPLVIIPFWLKIIGIRSLIVMSLVCYWGIRLTYNCFRRWKTIYDEDFRYTKFRVGYPYLYPLIDFFGLQLMPTIWVFLGCLPLYPILTINSPLNYMDSLAATLAIISQFYQTVSDNELWDYLNTPDRPPILKSGLWEFSRHPNYFGEVTFWWCLYLFVLAVDSQYWWTGIGALLVNILFVYVSVPLMDNRSIERRPGYEQYIKETSAIIPWRFSNTISKQEGSTKRNK
jgi:steroid 5-alpha reductase family enzyme